METVSDIKNYTLGNWRGVSGRFTSSDTSGDVATGLNKIIWVSMQGIDSQDNNVQIARNTTTTTDNDPAAVVPGVFHFSSAGSGAIYQFTVEGF